MSCIALAGLICSPGWIRTHGGPLISVSLSTRIIGVYHHSGFRPFQFDINFKTPYTGGYMPGRTVTGPGPVSTGGHQQLAPEGYHYGCVDATC